MKKTSEPLFAVASSFHTGKLLKPFGRRIFGGDSAILRRIILARTPEDAILLTYPHFYKESWSILRLKLFMIDSSKVRNLRTPEHLEKYFGFKKAIEFGEHASFLRLNMDEVIPIKIIQNSDKNEILYTEDTVDEKGNPITYAKRYAIF